MKTNPNIQGCITLNPYAKFIGTCKWDLQRTIRSSFDYFKEWKSGKQIVIKLDFPPHQHNVRWFLLMYPSFSPYFESGDCLWKTQTIFTIYTNANIFKNRKKIIVFHPALAPYRVDFFNSLNENFDADFYFFNENLLNQKFNQDKLKKEIDFNCNYLKKGFFYRIRSLETSW